MDPLIHIHTASDKATTGYVRFMWETMLKLASHPEHLLLHIHCIGPRAVDELKDVQQAEAHQVKAAREGGSYGHAACIMDALSMTRDNCIHVICDSDAFVVAHGWDNLVRSRVKSGVGILGTTYEELGGFSSGGGNVQTYKRVPTFTWAIIAPGYDWFSLDVMPNKEHRIHIKNETMSTIYGLPVGHHVFGEAGYQLPQFIYDKKIQYEGWRQLKPSRDAVVLKGLTDYHEEFHVDQIPFVVHHRGSLRHPYRGSRMSNAFFEKVDAWIDNEKRSPVHWMDEALEKWTQLVLPFGYVEPFAQRVVPRPDVLEAWLKVTVDGAVCRTKGKVIDVMNVLSYPVRDGAIHHMRVEGLSNHPLFIELPNSTNHAVSIRNLTNVTVTVQKDARTAIVPVEPGTAVLLLTDVDGVVKVG